VLNELREALENNGFTRAEAEHIILPVPQGVLPLGAQPQSVQFAPAEIDVAVTEAQVAALGGKVQFDPARGELTIFVPLDADETERLSGCMKTPEAKAKVAAAAETVWATERAFGGSGKPRAPSFFERGVDFRVPLLCVAENGSLFEFEGTFLLEHPWQLSVKDASLAATYSPLNRPTGKTGYLKIGTKGEVQTGIAEDLPDADFVATLHQQVLQFGGVGEWTLERLVTWLDRQIDHRDIPAGEAAEFLRKAVRGLMARYGIDDLNVLALDRFRLRDQIATRIQQHRDSERQGAFQLFLLPDSPLTVSDERAINFKTMNYEPIWLYEGGVQFKKHYFGAKPGELRELAPGGGLTEEFRCAQFLDSLPEVQFWMRNLARKASSFRLQTSKDWFCPDFVCQLTDGRVLVVEYKGKHLYDGIDAEEKRAVGAVWAARSNGRCLFVMPTDGEFAGIAATMKKA
jgi:type III restriction enzyme